MLCNAKVSFYMQPNSYSDVYKSIGYKGYAQIVPVWKKDILSTHINP